VHKTSHCPHATSSEKFIAKMVYYTTIDLFNKQIIQYLEKWI